MRKTVKSDSPQTDTPATVATLLQMAAGFDLANNHPIPPDRLPRVQLRA